MFHYDCLKSYILTSVGRAMAITGYSIIYSIIMLPHSEGIQAKTMTVFVTHPRRILKK